MDSASSSLAQTPLPPPPPPPVQGEHDEELRPVPQGVKRSRSRSASPSPPPLSPGPSPSKKARVAQDPYIFVVFGEDDDLHSAFTLDSNDACAERIVETIERLVRRDLDQHRADASAALRLYASGRDLDWQDEAWAAGNPELAGIVREGKWTEHRIFSFKSPFSFASRKTIFLYGYL